MKAEESVGKHDGSGQAGFATNEGGASFYLYFLQEALRLEFQEERKHLLNCFTFLLSESFSFTVLNLSFPFLWVFFLFLLCFCEPLVRA